MRLFPIIYGTTSIVFIESCPWNNKKKFLAIDIDCPWPVVHETNKTRLFKIFL
jgi:hypothetical protein